MREAREPLRRTLIALASLLVLAFIPLDVYARSGFTPELLTLRFAFALLLLGIAGSRTRTPEAWERLNLVGAAGSSAFYVAIVVAAGGLASPQAIWLPVMPLATVLLAWERVGAVALGGAITLAGTVALVVREGAGPARVAIWGALVAGSAGLAVLTSLAFRLVQRAETAALVDRDEAQGRLGESERRRLRAERLASAGRLAAGIAHEVNSPLSAARSNLALLREELERAGVGVSGEGRDALSDTVEVVERIARIVGALRLFAAEDLAPGLRACEAGPAISRGAGAAGALLPPSTDLRCHVEPGLPKVALADSVLAQVILGIVLGAGNTLRPAQGGVRPEISVVARRDGDGVAIDVLDNGTGLPVEPSDGPREAGAPGRGVGAGLALAREFVELAGGRLELANRPEGGARYRLWLPGADDRAPGAGP